MVILQAVGIFVGWTITCVKLNCLGMACPERAESWRKSFHMGQSMRGCGRCFCEAWEESWLWLYEGLLKGREVQGAGVWVDTSGAEGSKHIHIALGPEKTCLWSHPLLHWWMAIPVSQCIGIILCRTQKSPIHYIAGPIFFPFSTPMEHKWPE